MQQIQKKLADVMKNIKKQNPNANWKNLVTGLLILVLVGVFSVWYFSDNQVLGTDTMELNLEEEAANAIGDEDEMMEEGSVAGDEDEMTEESVMTEWTGETTIVEAGESLWKVAMRVCGRGEAYNYLADANGMTIWSHTEVGQTLRVDCGPEGKN